MKLIISIALATGLAQASDALPIARQNELVKTYCAVCHTDASRNGGLTLQHFDAAQLDPSLAAMLLSKLNAGAFGAAGLPIPDKPTEAAWIAALTSQSAGADRWTVTRGDQGQTTATSAAIASIVAQTRHPDGTPSLWRLAVSCDGIQLSWSPTPKTGILTVSVDGNAPLHVPVEGREKMGNGTAGTTGPASVMLKLPLPVQSLRVGDLFPGQTVEFPFSSLNSQARTELAACAARHPAVP